MFILILSLTHPLTLVTIYGSLILNGDAVWVKTGAFLSTFLVPEGGRQDLCWVASVLVLLDNFSNLSEKSSIQGGWLKSQVTEFTVGNIELVLSGLLTWIGQHIHFYASLFSNECGNITYTARLGDLVENFDAISSGRWVVDGNFDTFGGIGDVDEGTGLSSSSVYGKWNSHGALHKETVEDGSVITVVIEAVDEAFILDGLWCVGSPYDSLVEVSDAE
mmetsp:Transcript_5429/g.6650  ORF Transcript_5429/g.6650 Transcript_5429/m.6650 type:complete len:219 (+) Transcript_5429:229-885(+)